MKNSSILPPLGEKVKNDVVQNKICHSAGVILKPTQGWPR